MQVSRHWRLNSQRYRLEGMRYNNEQVSLQHRPVAQATEAQEQDNRETSTMTEITRLHKVAS